MERAVGELLFEALAFGYVERCREEQRLVEDRDRLARREQRVCDAPHLRAVLHGRRRGGAQAVRMGRTESFQRRCVQFRGERLGTREHGGRLTDHGGGCVVHEQEGAAFILDRYTDGKQSDHFLQKIGVALRGVFARTQLRREIAQLSLLDFALSRVARGERVRCEERELPRKLDVVAVEPFVSGRTQQNEYSAPLAHRNGKVECRLFRRQAERSDLAPFRDVEAAERTRDASRQDFPE